jgi:hypothetical protein
MDSRANISSTTEVSRVARVFVTIRLQPREQLTIRLLGEIRGIERADGRRSLGGRERVGPSYVPVLLRLSS